MRGFYIVLATIVTSVGISPKPALASTCFGTPANGRIENAVALATTGNNFVPYTRMGVTLGRTYVHASVRDIVEGAYKALEQERPTIAFVYGETGLKHGGPFPPHRTHQTGTSVDFMVPVLDRHQRPTDLPRSVANRFGYDLEFDSKGRYEDLHIDFDAIAAHLSQLDRQARKHGVKIARVIFDPALTQRLFETPSGSHLKAMPFMKTKPWVRHDEHYHVDFVIRCEPGK